MKIHFVSLGCDKNLVDSEIMLGILKQAGHEITSEEESADVFVINTCGFIMDATKESIDTVLRLAEYKKEDPSKGLIVTGCMVKRYKEDILKELPEVDAIVGPKDYGAIGRVIDEIGKSKNTGKKEECITLISDQAETDETLAELRVLSTPSHFAYLKIAEGCDNHCTYCTIPKIRGPYKSRSLQSLRREAELLAKKGVKELILVAQDTALYGKDSKEIPDLATLVTELSKIEGIEWIRILYAYPEHITDELIQVMASNEKVCNYLDMPIQHCSDGILRAMKRTGTKAGLVELIQKLRQQVPGISIRTTLIVGFPGETEEQFQELCDFVEQMEFERMGAFAYSREEGTPAAKMPRQVSAKIKKERLNKLMKLQQSISKKKNQQKIGTVLKVMTEGYLPQEDIYCGRSYMDTHEVDGLVFFKPKMDSDEADFSAECLSEGSSAGSFPTEIISGDFVYVRIKKASEYDLEGEICEPEV